MLPTALYALGLGDIRLKSALNQPLDAEIELVDATAEDLAALRASLASNDTFARYGLDRPVFLSEFSFAVARGASGRDVLRVSSARPVTEPFVTFLVEATWPRGRLLREYTVLLDPPVYAPGPSATEAPVVTPQATTAAPRPSAAQSYPAAPAAPEEGQPRRAVASAPSVEAGSSYQVRPNDTLWQIASGAYPGTRSDVNRAMLAIYQANPAAFDGNINVLRAGSELQIPDSGAITQISAAAAADEVARQYRQWREAAGADDAARLRLVTPEQGSAAVSTAVPSTAASTPGSGSANLQARVQQLEAELAEARRLLEVRNAELATLQGQAVPTTPAAEPAVPPGQAPTAVEPPAAEAPVAEPVPAPVAEEPKPETAAPAKPAAREPEQPSLLARLIDYWWVLAGVALALGAWFFFRRKQREHGTAADTFEEAFTSRDLGDLRERPTRVGQRPEADILVEERHPVEAVPVRPRPTAVASVSATPASREPERKPVSLDDTLSSDAAASIEAGDPLAEADFHMAYGLYDQAADLVQLAIKREPQRRDLKLKLLEIFFVWGNRDRFLEVAREIRQDRGNVSASEWDKVLIMGKQIAQEDPLFAQAATAGATSVDMELAATTALTDLDFLSEAPDSTATDIDLGEEGEELIGSTGIDFILDEPLRGADLASLAPTVESATLDSSSTEPTQEVPLENLGLEVDALSDLEDADDLFVPAAPAQVEDTVERPLSRGQVEDTVERPAAHRGEPRVGDEDDTLKRRAVQRPAEPATEDEEDTLSQTGITRGGTTTMRIPKTGDSTGVMPLLDPTGELPTIETTRIQHGPTAKPDNADFAIGDEPATMSEVGTKLDLARAYIDMGDPEGARSILEEVLEEGSSSQKQEAQRLMSSLP
jgi:pilus assembly protein FimV